MRVEEGGSSGGRGRGEFVSCRASSGFYSQNGSIRCNGSSSFFRFSIEIDKSNKIGKDTLGTGRMRGRAGRARRAERESRWARC